MTCQFFRALRGLVFLVLAAAASVAVAGVSLVAPAHAQEPALRGGTLRVAILTDMTNFDPQQFSAVNFHLIKNLYDSLIEYTPEGEAVPSLATAWQIAPDNQSVRVTLRDDVSFASGAKLTSADVAATLAKAADPGRGKNVYATMSIVTNWTTPDDRTIVIHFKAPAPQRQITDLLQFTMPIEAAGIASVETVPAGTGAYMLDSRAVGQGLRLRANPHYWRQGQPVTEAVDFTIFSDDVSASAALESDAVDIIYGSSARSAVRLQDVGYQVLRGPGPLVQVFRINSTRAPFTNPSFRQAFNYLMDREGMLRVGYAGLGEVAALPWAPASPAFDATYADEFAYNLDKAKELLAASGLTPAEQSDWKMLVGGDDEPTIVVSQILQSALAEVGIDIELDILQGAEYTEALLAGDFDATFGAVGNVQKFPSRVATNSIYRVVNNPVLKDPHPDYVAAIERVNTTSDPAEVKAAYDNLNRVLVTDAFAIPTNSYDTGLIVASPRVGGLALDIDNLFVARMAGFQ
ncbi:ABC transporter substrate-binding protein [Kaistia nematophila]|uniref:ABC transporter substrate-binding protein n=1 Tax=Kaistia nematophila TaxID=2994654 RepID=A0A9X3EF15_9HYPH|nr:ABC transporter substrate-binding protein [Kaistia nematophila]MCX5571990.1 ABC transporter substrate-binding protein [Kaistia nematophila]